MFSYCHCNQRVGADEPLFKWCLHSFVEGRNRRFPAALTTKAFDAKSPGSRTHETKSKSKTWDNIQWVVKNIFFTLFLKEIQRFNPKLSLYKEVNDPAMV